MRPPIHTAREMYAEFARGDIEAVLDLLDPEVEWVVPETLPWARGPYRGPGAVAEYFTSFATALDDAAVEPHELLGCRNGVVSLGTERALVRTTGERFAVPFAHVIRIRDGRVVSLHGHVDTAAIRAAFEPGRRGVAQA